MKTYIIYNTQTGDIRKAITAASTTQVSINLRENESYIFDSASSAKNILDYTVNLENLTLEPKPPDISKQWELVRRHRDGLISASDWTQLPDIPEELSSKWIAYRQALRDITQQSDPFSIVWPIPPV
jgi:hypothetical protein